MIGKISSLPLAIREQVNQRLDDNISAELIIEWLNALPEVQAVLQAKFDGASITPQNVTEYRKRSYSKWRMRREASEFVSDAQTEQAAPLQGQPLLDQLTQWGLIRFAAAANAAAVADDPDAELRQTRGFLADIIALRRGELISRRVNIDQQRLELLRDKKQSELDEMFWKWTQRPDINSKLYPHRDPEKICRDVVRMIDRKILGIKHSPDDPPEPEALCYI